MTDRTRTAMHDDTPAALLLALRGMRGEEQPGRELWAGIAARIANDVRSQPGTAVARRRRHGPAAFLAAAATLALALGVGWRAAHLPDRSGEAAGSDPLLIREADALDREYEGALREALAARADEPIAEAELGVLDRSAAEIRAALARDPDAIFLLDQLQRVRARRLALTLDLPRLP